MKSNLLILSVLSVVSTFINEEHEERREKKSFVNVFPPGVCQSTGSNILYSDDEFHSGNKKIMKNGQNEKTGYLEKLFSFQKQWKQKWASLMTLDDILQETLTVSPVSFCSSRDSLWIIMTESPFTWTHIRLLLLFVCAVGLLFSVGINFTPSAATIDLRSLDRHENLSYRQFDIVLSYYKEDLSFVARFIRYLRNVSTIEHRHPRVIVYNKNPQMNSSHLRQTLLADLVIPLPNYGREGATYLTHIINNYHTLADHTLFSQAGVEGVTETGLSPWFSDRLIRQFNSTVGYMPMVDENWISTYDCGHNSPGDTFPRLTELWAMVEHSLCPPGGQAVRIAGRCLDCWKTVVGLGELSWSVSGQSKTNPQSSVWDLQISARLDHGKHHFRFDQNLWIVTGFRL